MVAVQAQPFSGGSPAMTESNHTPERVTLVAVDIAKHYHDVLIEPPAPKRRCRLRVANTLEEF